jgi:hypothetical protein
MRTLRIYLLPAIMLGAALICAGASAAPGPMGANSEVQAGREGRSPLIVRAKVKCGIDDDGDFGCKIVKKKGDKGNQQNEQGKQDQPSKGHKCTGNNDCPNGYRALTRPNKYGACCEQIPSSGCNVGCKNHCTNQFVAGSKQWNSCVAGCGC